jgi:hypothetical protein
MPITYLSEQPARAGAFFEPVRIAVKLSTERQYRLAQRVDLHPTTLSKWMNGAETPAPDDPRVRRLAAILGVQLDEAGAA